MVRIEKRITDALKGNPKSLLQLAEALKIPIYEKGKEPPYNNGLGVYSQAYLGLLEKVDELNADGILDKAVDNKAEPYGPQSPTGPNTYRNYLTSEEDALIEQGIISNPQEYPNLVSTAVDYEIANPQNGLVATARAAYALLNRFTNNPNTSSKSRASK